MEQALITPDGEGIVWWHDATGDERGRWLVAPFGGGEARPLLDGVPDGWSMGLAIAPGRVAVGLALDDESYAVFVAVDAGPAREVARFRGPAGVGREWPVGTGGLSADGALLCVRHTEHGDLLHPALRVLDARTGAVVAEQRDPGRLLDPVAWSPAPGDDRLAITHEREAFERPAIWDPATGERRDVPVRLSGAAFPLAWWPDASALLVRHEREGLDSLHRVDVASGEAAPVADPLGEIAEAGVRPDGAVWWLGSTSARPPRLADAESVEVLAPAGEPAPAGRPYRSLWFEDPAGLRIQAFVVTPPGEGPFPIVMSVHGGPEWHERDRFDPETQAFVDHGFAVALVNYRGSTGYGVAFRESLRGDIGFPESEDVVACLDTLIADGVADRDRAFFCGWSWGGYLACLNAGLNPDRWRAVFAGIPTGDYVAAHRACSPPLRAWDLAVMGGSPEEVPDLYRERDPMTYVDRVRAPVLVIAGEHDSRCPIEGVTPWTDAVRARGVPVELHLYGAGHHANDAAQQVEHMRLILGFFERHLG